MATRDVSGKRSMTSDHEAGYEEINEAVLLELRRLIGSPFYIKREYENFCYRCLSGFDNLPMRSSSLAPKTTKGLSS